MKNKFNGYYFKHQNKENTVAFIPGISDSGSFIQVITNKKSYNFNFPTATINSIIKVGNCTFSKRGIYINLPNIIGNIFYEEITPLKSDIMGVFRFFPMECRHGIISMRHKLAGKLTIDGEIFDFNNGTGYIEKDSGISFPKKYLWLQCNDFEDCSIMISVAEIPFIGITFQGCICAVVYGEKEYRLATYYGVKVKILCNKIILSQRKHRLEVDYSNSKTGQPLASPIMGKMCGIVHENNSAHATFKFYQNNTLVFEKSSTHVSLERFNI